jgi:transposase
MEEAVNKKYIVRLTAAERGQLGALVKRGQGQAYKIKHAHILLKADADGPGWSDERMAEAFGCHLNTPKNIRQRFVEQGLAAALERKRQERPSRERILDGQKQARLIALSCSTPPRGYARWTLHLLAGRLVELRLVESISHETVRQALKKTS